MIFQSEPKGHLIRTREEPLLQIRFKGNMQENSLLKGPGEGEEVIVEGPFHSIQNFKCGIKPTYTESDLFYSNLLIFSVNLIQNHPHRNTQNNV